MNMKDKKVLIFDLDDTLLECAKNYRYIISLFITKIVKIFDRYSPHPCEIATKHLEYDSQLTNVLFYKNDKFSLSFIETYKYFHRKIYKNENYNETYIKELNDLACSVYNIIPVIIPNVIETLETIKNNENYIIYMFTAGEQKTQEFKIKSTGLYNYINQNQIFVRYKKTTDELNEIYNHIKNTYGVIDKKNIYMIGDSVINDILPSLEFGINAILIKTPNYDYEDINNENYHYVTDIKDILDIVN